jgi:hypothetical protein
VFITHETPLHSDGESQIETYIWEYIPKFYFCQAQNEHVMWDVAILWLASEPRRFRERVLGLLKLGEP